MYKIKNNQSNDVVELPISDCLKRSYNWLLPIANLIIGITLVLWTNLVFGLSYKLVAKIMYISSAVQLSRIPLSHDDIH